MASDQNKHAGGMDPDLLLRHTLLQLQACSPGDEDSNAIRISRHLTSALDRLEPILKRTSIGGDGTFDHLHSLQYATYLYLIANEIWLHEGVNSTSERLFLLNRSLNSLDLYYKIQLPRIFVIVHGLGSVLVNTQYGENFVFFQHTTVGRLGDLRPTIGSNVILFPGSAVLGASTIGSNSVLSAGTIVSNRIIPENSMVFPGVNGNLVIKPRQKDYISFYVRDRSL